MIIKLFLEKDLKLFQKFLFKMYEGKEMINIRLIILFKL